MDTIFKLSKIIKSINIKKISQVFEKKTIKRISIDIRKITMLNVVDIIMIMISIILCNIHFYYFSLLESRCY